MITVRYLNWFSRHRRKAMAVALSGWFSLSLVLVFWPCCQSLADDHPAIASSTLSGDHGQDHAPRGLEDPCKTWLDSTNSALASAPDFLVLDPGKKIVRVPDSGLPAYPLETSATPGHAAYGPAPPGSLPLYLRIKHLLI